MRGFCMWQRQQIAPNVDVYFNWQHLLIRTKAPDKALSGVNDVFYFVCSAENMLLQLLVEFRFRETAKLIANHLIGKLFASPINFIVTVFSFKEWPHPPSCDVVKFDSLRHLLRHPHSFWYVKVMGNSIPLCAYNNIFNIYMSVCRQQQNNFRGR